eukprot:6001539-Pyramimonas_sp.AAC.1
MAGGASRRGRSRSGRCCWRVCLWGALPHTCSTRQVGQSRALNEHGPPKLTQSFASIRPTAGISCGG